MERKSLRMMKSIKVSSEEMVKWPPRSYICSFCKREFRSAQALGGHMNVHRKERARQLILSPPPLLTNNHRHFDINAQPCEESWIRQRSPSTSPSKMLSPFAASAVVSPSRSSISRPSWGEIKKRVSNFKKDAEVSNLGLDLEIGNMLSDSKKHLDLELRLGYSNN